MTKTELAKLLTILSGYDRRQVDDITVEAWHAVPEIAAARYEPARDIVVAHQTGPAAAEYFAVRHLVAGLRRRDRTATADIEADVRSAKARGIVARDWPTHEPLSTHAADALAAARERDRQETLRHSPESIGRSSS